MAFNRDQFKDLITRVITEQKLYSKAAINLLLGTAAVESNFGTYFRQIGGGPGRGPFQMEAYKPDDSKIRDEQDIWVNYLCYNRRSKQAAVYKISGIRSYDNNGALEGNFFYAICMARLHYRRIPFPFPDPDNIEALGYYWDIHYNRNPDKGTVAQFIEKYNKYVRV